MRGKVVKKYILFGAGHFGKRALQYLGKENVECFVDNDQTKIGQEVFGKKIMDFHEYKNIYSQYKTIITSSYTEEIKKQLEENGVHHYQCYSPLYENYIAHLKKELNGKEIEHIVLYGVDEWTEQIISALRFLELGDKIRYVALPDENSKKMGRKISDYQVCLFSEVDISDCYIVSSANHHMSLFMQLKQITGEGVIIDPFRQKGYYETKQIIVNPYAMDEGEKTEEKWNEAVKKDRNKGEIRAYVDMVCDRPQLFEFVEIETINRCNGVCSFCPVNKKIDKRPKVEMSKELFENIIGQLERIDYSGELSLFSNNEPLLDKHILERHKYAREHLPKARMHLFTNGTLFTLELFKDLMVYLDELIIDNYRQDLQLIKPCREIKEYVETHPELREKVTIVLRKPQEILTSRGGESPNRRQMVSYGNETCALPFQQLVIRPDGKVSLCCNDPLGKCTLGDLTKETIEKVWYGQKFQAVRQCLSRGRKNWKHCELCDTFYIY